VLDMTGNVREFVSDFYQKDYYPRSPYYDPTGPEVDLGKYHLARGGGWYDHARLASNWVRHDEASAELYEHIGFRCARNAPVTPMPTPTSAPTPTPLPSDAGYFGAEGGLLWITHPGHLTALHIPAGTLSGTMTSEITLSVTYTQPRPVGDFYGADHFFVVDGALSVRPVEVLLGFKDTGAMITGTEELYRLDATAWVTDSITTSEHSSGHILAWIDRPGLYAILGQTNRTYLPMILRR